MTIDELKERIQAPLKSAWEKFKDTNLYNQLKDRFENLSSVQQKLTLMGATFLTILLLLMSPIGNMMTSSEEVNEFVEKRTLVRDLLRVHRDVSENPALAQPPPPETLKGMVDAKIKELNFLPEQVKSIDVVQASSRLIPPNLLQGEVAVFLTKLNVKQVVNIGSKLQEINPSVKLHDMVMNVNKEDSRYYDVVFKLVVLNIPKYEPPPPPEPEKKGGKKPSKPKDEE